jgi:hypothetical protein
MFRRALFWVKCGILTHKCGGRPSNGCLSSSVVVLHSSFLSLTSHNRRETLCSFFSNAIIHTKALPWQYQEPPMWKNLCISFSWYHAHARLHHLLWADLCIM